jgi:predicted DNA-binding protein
MTKARNIGIRVNLTLPADAVAVLDRIAAATGTGRATMLREVVIDGLPGLRDMATALELAQQKNTDAFKVMAKAIGNAANEADQLLLDIKRTSRRMRRKKT